MKNTVNKLEFPEIFFGVVSPVGVDVQPTINSLERNLKDFGYEIVKIKITDYFESIRKYMGMDADLDRRSTDKRIENFIDFGNKVREKFGDDSILAAYSIFRIVKERKKLFQRSGSISYQKVAYIVQQFKRQEEIELMRSVYGEQFFQISIYSKKESRVNYLSHKLAHERNTADQSQTRPKAYELVARDENERLNGHGQRVAKIFHDADFVVNCDLSEKNAVETQVNRFIELLFSSNGISPSKLEYGMFAAKAAALRTLDLSRQVGAAIFRNTGEIISMGSNEVPKAGGGTYWCDEMFDAREFTKGVDSNDQRKRELLHEIFLATDSALTFEEFCSRDAVRDSQFMDALEYGRIVHAEMSAITDAARLGLGLKEAVLFCTTFPCHMCAKHIVASGISRVVFLEPYPKSLATDLHSDSLSVEGGPRLRYDDYPSVDFEHFHGITPRRYRQLFERGSRKKDGAYQPYIGNNRRPNLSTVAPFYIGLEAHIVRTGLSAYQQIIESDAAS